MANKTDFRIDMSEITAQLKKLGRFDIIEKIHLRKWAGQVWLRMVTSWKRIAPVDQGRYRSSIQGDVRFDARGGVNAEASSPVKPYPAILEDSPRYHYARGPRRGQQTKGQAEFAIEGVEPEANSLMRRTLNAIAKALTD